MFSELAQYAIQDFCSSHGWALSSFEGNYKLPKDLFLVYAELDLNVTFLLGKFLKSRSTKAPQDKKELRLFYKTLLRFDSCKYF